MRMRMRRLCSVGADVVVLILAGYAIKGLIAGFEEWLSSFDFTERVKRQ
jgi:hypothetical protein